MVKLNTLANGKIRLTFNITNDDTMSFAYSLFFELVFILCCLDFSVRWSTNNIGIEYIRNPGAIYIIRSVLARLR